MNRVEVIAAVFRHPAPVRLPLAWELRGPVVQFVGSGTTDPTWQATPELLASAVDAGLARAEREEKDIPTGTAFTPLFTPLPSDGHALIIRPVGTDYLGSCQCGQAIGRTPRTKPIDHLAGLWERHAAPIRDQAWADALTALPAASVNGAS
ncbi:hypothetical protein [Streptomyces sp. NPDC050263]|uniref:hypothetical protein n=1 Tax=Streptomyces sp. NPDC050263 TaxID=3155037 RepID=UPI00343E1FD3